MNQVEGHPILIGPGNSLQATGAGWHWWRRHAAEFGLQLITIGSKRFIRADAVLAVVEARAATRASTRTVDPELDELAEFRNRIARAG
ncbi:MAG TPA: hypothetical protein VH062_13470 [Polyangiaceae bacterium]|nr:hypothetical protein [Polyangiaceae bacterium]